MILQNPTCADVINAKKGDVLKIGNNYFVINEQGKFILWMVTVYTTEVVNDQKQK